LDYLEVGSRTQEVERKLEERPRSRTMEYRALSDTNGLCCAEILDYDVDNLDATTKVKISRV
jgi:hypothetical protein